MKGWGGKRPGQGRKRKYQDGTRCLTVSLPAGMIAALDAEAQAKGLSRSEVIHHYLKEGLKMAHRYEVKHIDVNAWLPDGGKVYDYILHFRTWRELVKDLKERHAVKNVIFHGKGADIFCDGVLIGHTQDLFEAIADPERCTMDWKRATRARLMAIAGT